MGELIKEVYFQEWCPKCKHSDLDETEDPCNECLYTPGREYSHKPVNFEQKDSK